MVYFAYDHVCISSKVVETEGTAIPYWKHLAQDPGKILSRILRFEHFLSRSLKSCVLLESTVLGRGLIWARYCTV